MSVRIMDIGMLSPPRGGEYVALEFHALFRYLLEYDLFGRRGALYKPLILLHASQGRGGSPVRSRSTSSPASSACRCLYLFRVALIARTSRLIRVLSASYLRLIPPRLSPHGDSLIDESPRLF